MGGKPKTKQPPGRSVNTSSAAKGSDTDDGRVPWSDRVHEHLALIVSVVVGSSIVIRVFASARYDPVTAMALVQAAGVGTAALGGLLASLPVFAFGGFFLLLVDAAKSISAAPSSERSLRGIFLGAGAVICALLMPVGLLVLATLACAARSLQWLIQRRRPSRKRSDSDSAKKEPPKLVMAGVSIVLGLGSVQLVVAYFGQPWVPSETIDVRDKKDFKGYVLSESADEVVVLRDDSRRIVRIKKSELTKRSLCRGDLASGDGTSLAALLVRESKGDDYPECPS